MYAPISFHFISIHFNCICVLPKDNIIFCPSIFYTHLHTKRLPFVNLFVHFLSVPVRLSVYFSVISSRRCTILCCLIFSSTIFMHTSIYFRPFKHLDWSYELKISKNFFLTTETHQDNNNDNNITVYNKMKQKIVNVRN